MSRYIPQHSSEPILAAGRRWFERCWVADSSLFSDEPLWTATNLAVLKERFVDNPDETDRSFYDKLEGQLAPADPAVKKLAAEMLWMLLLFQSNVSPHLKRESVIRVWGWSGSTLSPDQKDLADSTLAGIGSAGVAFNTQRWREVNYFILASQMFKAQPLERRRALMADPWEFAAWLSTVKDPGSRQLRNMLSYFAFPDTFERISVSKDKRRILAAIGQRPESEVLKLEDMHLDRALLDLRTRLQEELGREDLDFYTQPLLGRWRTSDAHWLLAWNPARFEWKELPELIAKSSRGESAVVRWSCSSQKPRIGDTAWLVRVGVKPTAIMAKGEIASEPSEEPHWDPAKAQDGETRRFVQVEFSDIRDPSGGKAIPTQELSTLDESGQRWTPQSSGIAIKPEAAQLLESLWDTWEAGAASQSLDWQGVKISRADVEKAFQSANPDVWESKAGKEPYWLIRHGSVEKPVKAVFRAIPQVGDAVFNTHQAVAVFKQLGFVIRNAKATSVADEAHDGAEGRTWLIAAGHDAMHWGTWQSDGVITLGYGLGDLRAYKSKQDVVEALRDPSGDEPEPTNHALAIWEFTHEMQVGDRVYAKQGTQRILGVGRIVGNYEYRPKEERPNHFRKVAWEKVGDWKLPDTSKFALKTLTEITQYPDFRAEIENLVGLADTAPHTPVAIAEKQAPYSLEELAEETGYSLVVLRSWLTRLRRKGQIVLHGPPGTGKTFIAERLARHLASGTRGNWSLVQFHPSYAYEDFVQGLRPKVGGAGLQFELVNGHFVDFCEKAKSLGTDATCVLVIDEINRAKLSQVFGELMYALEYRDHIVRLSSGSEFSVPANVYLIGTMNTADRSIAMVDHALRRRFSFVAVPPAYDVLERHLDKLGIASTGLVGAVKLVNRVIDNPNYALGISFFLQPAAVIRKDLEDIWRGEVEPYLDEYFFDAPEKVKALRWESISATHLADWPG